jgi:hypothetical protein
VWQSLAQSEALAKELAASDYVGWCVHVLDGASNVVPIFEHVSFADSLSKGGAGLAQPIAGAFLLPHRREDRQTMKFENVPHTRAQRLELYFARHKLEQPAVKIDREPGADVRFFQMKMGGVVVQSGAGGRTGDGPGQQRLGVAGYRVGYWDRRHNKAEMVEVKANGEKRLIGPVKHPCLPRIELPGGELSPDGGFGLNPTILGLTEADVPSLEDAGRVLMT